MMLVMLVMMVVGWLVGLWTKKLERQKLYGTVISHSQGLNEQMIIIIYTSSSQKVS